MISPILTYNSEACGAFIKSDFKYWGTSSIEKGLQILFASENKASNIACRAEVQWLISSYLRYKQKNSLLD